MSLLRKPEVQKAISVGITAFGNANGATAQQSALAAVVAAVEGGLVEVATQLFEAIDELTVELAEHCCKQELPAGLTAKDVLNLRAAVLTVNSPAELLGMEKNSVAGVLPTMEAPAENSPTDGGETPSESNPTSRSKPTSSTPDGHDPTS